jgi:hypothetical protein
MADFELPKTWREAVPYIVWGVLILGFGLEFTTNLVRENWLSAVLSFSAMTGLAAMALHWRQLRSWAATISPNWVTGAFVLLLLALIATPFFEQRRWPFSAWFQPPPSAEEIAQSVIRLLPPQAHTISPTNQPATSQPSIPYVNPLHDPLSKWKIVQGLRSAILRSGLSANCHITIIRYPETYAEDYAADFKEILDVIGWKYDEHFAQGTLEKGLTIRAIDAPGLSKECAQALSTRLSNDMRTRTVSSPYIGPYNLLEADAPAYLKDCPAGCIEVDFGNEDTSR